MSKRKRQAILFFTYGFMTLATLVISAICLLLLLGYRFDITDHTIEQGGLIQFRSLPAGANITFDNKQLGFRTPGKLDASVGAHTVTMQRQGYSSWSKSVQLDAGELLWLNYARLIPNQVKTTAVLPLAGTVQNALPTPDRRFVASLPEVSQPTIQFVDLRNKNSLTAKTITIPSDQLTVLDGQSSTYKIAEWDFGSRFLLLMHQTGDIYEYIRLDRTADDGAPRNITKEFNLPFRSMYFSGTSGNVLYALTQKDLRRIDTGSGSVSQPLVQDVETYRLYRENDIAFVALRADKRIAGVFLGDKETIVRSVSADTPMLADIGRYYSHYYLALTTEKGVTVIKDPAESSEASTRAYAELPIATHGKSWLDVSNSGRFILAGDAQAYTLYDLETENNYTVTFETSRDGADAASWIDDFYLVSSTSGTVKISEFDGQNRHDIASAAAGLPAFLSEDGKVMYSFVVKDSKTSLQASKLVLD